MRSQAMIQFSIQAGRAIPLECVEFLLVAWLDATVPVIGLRSL
jgi:hypothetical protein